MLSHAFKLSLVLPGTVILQLDTVFNNLYAKGIFIKETFPIIFAHTHFLWYVVLAATDGGAI
jgi:hypothetical protein